MGKSPFHHREEDINKLSGLLMPLWMIRESLLRRGGEKIVQGRNQDGLNQCRWEYYWEAVIQDTRKEALGWAFLRESQTLSLLSHNCPGIPSFISRNMLCMIFLATFFYIIVYSLSGRAGQ